MVYLIDPLVVMKTHYVRKNDCKLIPITLGWKVVLKKGDLKRKTQLQMPVIFYMITHKCIQFQVNLLKHSQPWHLPLMASQFCPGEACRRNLQMDHNIIIFHAKQPLDS